MNTQPQNIRDKESQLTLELLQAIDSNDDISQRHLAQQMGVALGLANSYLKRCVKKGMIKMKTAPANRYLYYLTPHGFSEKARLTGEFLSTSLALFRESGRVYSEIFDNCAEQGFRRVAFVGISDLTEIAYTRSLRSNLEIVGVLQPNKQDQAERNDFFGLTIFAGPDELPDVDCVVMTSLEQTNQLLELLSSNFSEEKIIVPSLLLNMNYRNELAEG